MSVPQHLSVLLPKGLPLDPIARCQFMASILYFKRYAIEQNLFIEAIQFQSDRMVCHYRENTSGAPVQEQEINYQLIEAFDAINKA